MKIAKFLLPTLNFVTILLLFKASVDIATLHGDQLMKFYLITIPLFLIVGIIRIITSLIIKKFRIIMLQEFVFAFILLFVIGYEKIVFLAILVFFILTVLSTKNYLKNLN